MKTSWGANKIILIEHDFVFGMDRDEAVKEMKEFLKGCCKMTDYFALYHGTTYRHNIMMDGLLPTCNSRKHSYQSGNGYAYLSIYPDMAKFFGKMAYPSDEIKVYEVAIPLRLMLPDKDQIANKRKSFPHIGNDLATSLIYGSGCRVKGGVEPNLLEGIFKP